MKFHPDIHHRKSLRLKNYDYSQNNLYFVTICVQRKENLLGQIIDSTMNLNSAGLMIEKWYFELENKFKNLQCLDFIIMPNHIHFILEIKYQDENITLSNIIQWFKTMTTNEYIRNVKENQWQPFDKKLWQRNYYEHIIRNDAEYLKISEYILNNPKTWQEDKLYNL